MPTAIRSCAASRRRRARSGGKGGISWIEITSTVNNPKLSPLAADFLEYVQQPEIAHTVAFAEGTFNPVAQMGNPECFKLFTKDELDAIQWDSLEEEMSALGRIRYRARLRQGARPDDGRQARRGASGGRRPGLLCDAGGAGPRGSRADACDTRRDEVQPTGAPSLRSFGGASTASTSTSREGEFLTIVGPSGSGKTTLLRMLAGMERRAPATSCCAAAASTTCRPNRRPTCLVFQSLALFPHKTVGENIDFPLKMRGVEPPAREARALELMRMMRLPESYYGKTS